MATTNDYIAAQDDADLLARFIAAAQMLEQDNARTWVVENYSALIAHEVSPEQQIVDVYAYAKTTREDALAALPPEPGKNMAAVTDEYLKAAVEAVRGTGAAEEPEA